MAGPALLFQSAALTNANESGANTETVVATVQGVTVRYAGQAVTLFGWFVCTPGATATAVTARIRRDSLTGTIVSAATAEQGNVTAAKPAEFVIAKVDQPTGELAGASYVITMQGTGEGGAASFQSGFLQALVS